jgi:soluble lytic murein transglycosylase-like protein
MKAMFIFVVLLIASLCFLSFAPAKAEKAPARLTVASSADATTGIEKWLMRTFTEAIEASKKMLAPKSPCSDSSYLVVHLSGLERVEKEYGKMIREKASARGLPENIAIALAVSESDGCPEAVNHNKDGSIDRGLFGLNDRGFGAGFSEQELLDPEKNADIALDSLAALLAKYNDVETALVAYKIGWGRVDSLMQRNDFNKDNYSVVEKVLKLAEKVN